MGSNLAGNRSLHAILVAMSSRARADDLEGAIFTRLQHAIAVAATKTKTVIARLFDWLADRLIASADDRSGIWMVRGRKDGTIEWVVDCEHLRRARLRCDVIQWLL